MCHFGGPVKGIMQEVEGFDDRFIECLGRSLRGGGGWVLAGVGGEGLSKRSESFDNDVFFDIEAK
jgi:hypothetical protein